MVEWESGMPLGAKLFMAEEVFNRRVLRIILSEVDKSHDVTRLVIKVSGCARAMSVVIICADI